MLQYILQLQEEIHEKEKKFESLRVSTIALSENDIRPIQPILTLLVCILYCYMSYLQTTYLLLNEI